MTYFVSNLGESNILPASITEANSHVSKEVDHRVKKTSRLKGNNVNIALLTFECVLCFLAISEIRKYSH